MRERWLDGWIHDCEIEETDGEIQKGIYLQQIECATHGEGERWKVEMDGCRDKLRAK